jgi:hypothetical protein
LKLKGSLLQVWLAQYMGESDDQVSWLSIATLMKLTGLSEHTVIDARKKLTEGGWMRCHAGKTAAQKYEKPTRGAHKVAVYSMDDLCKICRCRNCRCKKCTCKCYPPKNCR